MAHVPVIRLNNITQFWPIKFLVNFFDMWQSEIWKQARVSVCLWDVWVLRTIRCLISWSAWWQGWDRRLPYGTLVCTCHENRVNSSHWNNQENYGKWLAAEDLTFCFKALGWGEGRTVKKNGIHINWHVIQLPQVTLTWEEKTFQHFLELNTKYLCFIMCRQGKVQCVHIPNAYVLCISTNTWRCN